MGGKRSGSTSTDPASLVSGWVNFQSEASWWPKEFRRQFHWNFSWEIGRQVIVGLPLLQDRAFLDLFYVRSVIPFNWRHSKYISMCLFWFFMRWDPEFWESLFVLLCCSVASQCWISLMLNEPLVTIFVSSQALLSVCLFFTSSQFSDGWRDPMLSPSPISKFIQSSRAKLLSW